MAIEKLYREEQAGQTASQTEDFDIAIATVAQQRDRGKRE